MNNIYYVYAYLDPLKPCKLTFENLEFSFLYEPFYIGKGFGDRFKSHLENYKLIKKTHMSNKINKIRKNCAEPIIIKLYENLEENISLDIEKSLIKTIGRIVLKNGSLINITDGGEGTSGLKHSEKSKKLMSEKNSGERNSGWNKPRSQETKNKISIKLKANNPMHNPEISEKVRLKNLGRTPWNKGIKTPKDVCEKLSVKKLKYYNIKLISKKDNSLIKFNTLYEVADFLKKCYRSAFLYLQKGECELFYIKYDKYY